MPPIAAQASQLPTEQDLALLRRTIALSEQSRARGRHPFAALVADEHGNVISEAGNNSMPPEGDPTQHAELVAAAKAARLRTPQQLARATLYTSAEPCCMCAGAVYWTGIGRVVYALSEAARQHRAVRPPVFHMLRRYCPPTSNSAFVICPSEHTRTASISTSNTLALAITACCRRASMAGDSAAWR